MRVLLLLTLFVSGLSFGQTGCYLIDLSPCQFKGNTMNDFNEELGLFKKTSLYFTESGNLVVYRILSTQPLYIMAENKEIAKKALAEFKGRDFLKDYIQHGGRFIVELNNSIEKRDVSEKFFIIGMGTPDDRKTISKITKLYYNKYDLVVIFKYGILSDYEIKINGETYSY